MIASARRRSRPGWRSRVRKRGSIASGRGVAASLMNYSSWIRPKSFSYLRLIDYIKKEATMETDGLPKPDNVIFGEIQVLLAEKRTALAGLRTGIAVF